MPRDRVLYDDAIVEPGSTNNKRLSTDHDLEDVPVRLPQKRRKIMQCVKPAEPVFPASQFPDLHEGTTTRIPPELKALQQLLSVWHKDHEEDGHHPEWIMFELTDFTIYHPYRVFQNQGLERSYEMEALHFLNCKARTAELLIDGTLSYAGLALHIEGVPFGKLAIDGYGDPNTSDVTDGISIQSKAAEKLDSRLWFQLRQPCQRYERFHEAFLWVANLAKHFVDYTSEHDEVTLHDFKIRFYAWLLSQYNVSGRFKKWLDQARTTDFRQAVVANHEFLWNEHWQLNGRQTQHIPVWQEIYAGDLTAIPQQPRNETRTIVTPNVHHCFKDMYFKHCLKPVDPCDAVVKARRIRMKQMGFASMPLVASLSADAIIEEALKVGGGRIKVTVGDVVAVARDGDTAWKDTAALWLAYVQAIECRGRHMRPFLDVIWLYRPDDTTLAGANYPVANELFFSDNCNCGDQRIAVDEVLCKLDVDWSPKVISSHRIVVRQKFVTDEHSFVTLQDSDLTCCHHKEKSTQDGINECQQRYAIGDTAYMRAESSLANVAEWDGTTPDGHSDLADQKAHYLEPVAIVAFDKLAGTVTVRQLVRRQAIEVDAEPNELLWTDEILHIDPEQVVERCYIRLIDQGMPVPAPYDRQGNGHFWFVRMRLTTNGLESLEPCLKQIRESFTEGHLAGEATKHRPLQGLDLFCGGGNFGRGVEEGGAVRMKWAVDVDTIAIHTYRANHKAVEDVHLFLGSIDDYLSRLMHGEESTLIAGIGKIDCICGGSSCRGISNAQLNKVSAKSCKNTSLVASLASAVDIYRPKYSLFENVTSMASKHKSLQGQNVFAQLLCCLVAMGYQVTQFNLDAWSCGAPQSRGRLFITIAAPGLPLMEHPQLSHAHPPSTQNKSLGWAANGKSFGDRQFGPTPFDCVSAEGMTGDLPNIQDGRVGTCISHPDHRVPAGHGTTTRIMISMIPTTPAGSSFKKAAAKGLLPQPQLDLALNWNSAGRKSQKSKAWSRIESSKLFPTILRVLHPSNAFGGPTLHWSQHRTMTLMEARRAQGYPDDEVLIGRVREQWGVVGDAVCRQVALALGVRLREAWIKAELAEGQKVAVMNGTDDRCKLNRPKSANKAGGLVWQGPSSQRVMQKPADIAYAGDDASPGKTVTGIITGKASIGTTPHGTSLDMDMEITSLGKKPQVDFGHIKVRVVAKT